MKNHLISRDRSPANARWVTCTRTRRTLSVASILMSVPCSTTSASTASARTCTASSAAPATEATPSTRPAATARTWTSARTRSPASTASASTRRDRTHANVRLSLNFCLPVNYVSLFYKNLIYFLLEWSRQFSFGSKMFRLLFF